MKKEEQMSYLTNLLAKDEQIAFSTRKHWLAIVRAALGSLLLAAAALVIFLFIVVLKSRGSIDWEWRWILLFFGLILLFALVKIVWEFLQWLNEIYAVTNRRIIQSEGILNKTVIDSAIGKVNDVLIHQSLLGRILNYGDLEILTASDIGVNRLDLIAHPVRFKLTMLDQKTAHEGTEIVVEPKEEKEDIPSALERLSELKDKGLITQEEYEAKKKDLLSRM